MVVPNYEDPVEIKVVRDLYLDQNYLHDSPNRVANWINQLLKDNKIHADQVFNIQTSPITYEGSAYQLITVFYKETIATAPTPKSFYIEITDWDMQLHLGYLSVDTDINHNPERAKLFFPDTPFRFYDYLPKKFQESPYFHINFLTPEELRDRKTKLYFIQYDLLTAPSRPVKVVVESLDQGKYSETQRGNYTPLYFSQANTLALRIAKERKGQIKNIQVKEVGHRA